MTELTTEEIFTSTGGFVSMLLDEDTPRREPDVREWPQGDGRATFADVVGQERVLKLLRLEIAACRQEGRRLSDLLFVGPPGVGKSLLAEATANEASAVIYMATGPELATTEAAIDTLAGCGNLHDRTGLPVVLVVDELDGMPRVPSYVFHSMMLRQTVAWRGGTFGLCPLTILGTSNRLAKVPPAMRSRFAEVIHVDYYGVEALERIAEREARRRGIMLADGVARYIAENSGGEPRKTGHLMRALRNLLPGGRSAATLDDAKEALKLSGLKPGGLSRLQYRYLEFLQEMENGTAGVNSIAAFLGVDVTEIVGAVESFLIRSRLAVVTRGGRKITEKSIDYLRAASRGGEA